MPPIDFTSLRSTVAHLADGLRVANRNPDDELLRDGVIQRFEYTHELCLKFIRRILEMVFGDAVDHMAYNDVLWTGGMGCNDLALTHPQDTGSRTESAFLIMPIRTAAHNPRADQRSGILRWRRN
jgi:hypothetical protein